MRIAKNIKTKLASSNQAPWAHFCGWQVESESKADL